MQINYAYSELAQNMVQKDCALSLSAIFRFVNFTKTVLFFFWKSRKINIIFFAEKKKDIVCFKGDKKNRLCVMVFLKKRHQSSFTEENMIMKSAMVFHVQINGAPTFFIYVFNKLSQFFLKKLTQKMYCNIIKWRELLIELMSSQQTLGTTNIYDRSDEPLPYALHHGWQAVCHQHGDPATKWIDVQYSFRPLI